ncbi:MAG: zinc ribbon domain-containing protein [Planctomycetota bacterium]
MSSQAITTVECGACGEANAADAKFCLSCGHALYERCGECGKPVLLSQKYCGSCGTDLNVVIEKKRARLDQHLRDAVESAKQFNFEESLSLIDVVRSQKDFRFKELAEAAGKAYEQVETLRDRTLEAANQHIEAAVVADGRGDREALFNHLSKVPKQLLDDSQQALLRKSQNYLSEVKQLSSAFNEAISSKDWVVAGALIGQLTELVPDNEELKQYRKQVVDHLRSRARRGFEKGRYEKALDAIESIPVEDLDDETMRIQSSILDVFWMRDVLADATYASKPLYDLAQRLAKQTKQVVDNECLVELKKAIKDGHRNDRCHLREFRPTTSALGTRLDFLSRPTSIDCSDTQKVPIDYLGKMNLAFGLAMQGLADNGHGDVRMSDAFYRRKKKRFGNKKSSACWGLDIGSCLFKAVRLVVEDDRYVVTDQFSYVFSKVAGAEEGQSARVESLKDAVAAWRENCEVDSQDAVWSNLPSTASTCRSAILPPVADSELQEMVDREIQARVPLERSEIEVITQLQAFREEKLGGRSLSIAVAKKSHIEQRISMLGASGLEVDGMQTDALALLNFASGEFGEVMQPTQPSEKKRFRKKKNVEDEPDVESECTKDHCISFVDGGDSKTLVLITHRDAFWFWTVETGGADLDAAITRSTSLTSEQAKEVRHRPSACESPREAFVAVSRATETLGGRVRQLFFDAKKQNSTLEPDEIWLMGGVVQTLGWPRQLLGEEVSNEKS